MAHHQESATTTHSKKKIKSKRIQVSLRMTVPLGKHCDGDGALEDAWEDSGDHVSGVVLVGGDIATKREATTMRMEKTWRRMREKQTREGKRLRERVRKMRLDDDGCCWRRRPLLLLLLRDVRSWNFWWFEEILMMKMSRNIWRNIEFCFYI